MSTAAPCEVIERLLALYAKGPVPETADLFTEDAVFELPFLPPGVPHPEVGREPFRHHLREGAQIQRFDSVEGVHIHETADPEVVIAEYQLHGTVLSTGKRFAFSIIMVARVRDGLIAWCRSYSNPLDGAIAFDGVKDLLAELTTV
ncbi:nuclear transport factor 2 family protein [Nonomuraea sp. NEAU-A123]|uniref:nuclear transport factor 2 family protein n=1 Tax=Nonomuraea sp. NEAU-A123 TaxID=2839649 RepID=UPI001BE3FDC6|nr:nuclear transport factor 2 family protein [Nonomuraea sp. NEAU-A123]MBT2231004.1 nuclear transport factor 2 family protein [Nonomuraea sp. NEAU-A123]